MRKEGWGGTMPKVGRGNLQMPPRPRPPPKKPLSLLTNRNPNHCPQTGHEGCVPFLQTQGVNTPINQMALGLQSEACGVTRGMICLLGEGQVFATFFVTFLATFILPFFPLLSGTLFVPLSPSFSGFPDASLRGQ